MDFLDNTSLSQVFEWLSIVLVIMILYYICGSLNRHKYYDGMTPSIPSPTPSMRNEKINPEGKIMMLHQQGDKCPKTRDYMNTPLSTDELLVKSKETQNQSRRRYDMQIEGPLHQGMKSEIEAFEDGALSRQLYKKQEVYGTQSYNPFELRNINELL